MSNLSPDADDKAAFALFTEGKPHEAYLYLRQKKGMSLPDAKELMIAMREGMKNGDGASADLENAAREVMDVVDTFDELTLLVLRDLRDRKQFQTPKRTMSAQRAAKECSAIYDAIRALIDSDINPTTAMRAFVLKSDHGLPDQDRILKNVTMMQGVLDSHTLHNDILSLL